MFSSKTSFFAGPGAFFWYLFLSHFLKYKGQICKKKTKASKLKWCKKKGNKKRKNVRTKKKEIKNKGSGSERKKKKVQLKKKKKNEKRKTCTVEFGLNTHPG